MKYGLPEGKTSADYQGSVTSFGGSKYSDGTDKHVFTELPSISSGLVGTATQPAETPNVTVKNRYIMPIASTTISASNGHLHNSYGYKD